MREGKQMPAQLPVGSLCRQPPWPGAALPPCTMPGLFLLTPNFHWHKTPAAKRNPLPREAATGSELLAGMSGAQPTSPEPSPHPPAARPREHFVTRMYK